MEDVFMGDVEEMVTFDLPWEIAAKLDSPHGSTLNLEESLKFER